MAEDWVLCTAACTEGDGAAAAACACCVAAWTAWATCAHGVSQSVGDGGDERWGNGRAVVVVVVLVVLVRPRTEHTV